MATTTTVTLRLSGGKDVIYFPSKTFVRLRDTVSGTTYAGTSTVDGDGGATILAVPFAPPVAYYTEISPTGTGSWTIVDPATVSAYPFSASAGTLTLTGPKLAPFTLVNATDEFFASNPASTVTVKTITNGVLARRLLPRSEQTARMVATIPPILSTSGGNAASAIANPKDWPMTFTGNPVQMTGCYSYFNNPFAIAGYYGANFQNGDDNTPYAFDFFTDAPVIEVVYLGSSPPDYYVEVNGEFASTTAGVASGGTGLPHRLTISFVAGGATSGRAFRHIRVWTTSMWVSKITTSITDTVCAAPRRGIRALIVGDSEAQVNGLDSFYFTTAQLLGWDEAIGAASGGTGYIATGGKANFQTRAASYIVCQPDVIVLAGGINDSLSGLQAAATTLIQTFQAGISGVVIYALGPFATGTASAASQLTKGAAIQAACAATGATYIDNLTVPWVTGSGKVTAPALDGNADILIQSDGVHYTAPDGGRTIGTLLAAAIAAKGV